MTVLNAPIVLLCSERSGSNLIAKMLDVHPELCAPGACHLFRVMSECACTYPEDSDELRKAIWSLFDAKLSNWLIDRMPSGDRERLLASIRRPAEMVAAVYAAEAQAVGKPHILIKENSVFRFSNLIHVVAERPRYLFMTRDPRDMALSWAKAPAIRGGVMRATTRWIEDQAGYLRLLTELPGNAAVSFLRYEELLRNPAHTLRRVCGELGLSCSHDLTRFHERSRSAAADARNSTLWENLAKPLMTGNANKFEAELDADEIAYIEWKARGLMELFGYIPVRDVRDDPKVLEALEVDLAAREPYEKALYVSLSIEERRRLEAWSNLYASMRARPLLGPADLYRVAR